MVNTCYALLVYQYQKHAADDYTCTLMITGDNINEVLIPAADIISFH